MPCFPRKQRLSCCPRRNERPDLGKVPVKPVRPTAIRYHSLLGFNVSRHLIVDNNWTASSLTEQFARCIELLARRVSFKRHEAKTDRKQIKRKRDYLRLVCANGYVKLQDISWGNNAHDIRNICIKRRDMQRLYSQMPIHLVVDNINQRTFSMRKERDRLDFHLKQLQHKYNELLLTQAEVENRMRYANEFIIQNEMQSRILRKKIANSNVRAKAIRTINATYKKIIQILKADEVFYEPILRSLYNDMADQSTFTNYILYLGRPAIVKFKQLSIRYRKLQDIYRKNLQSKIEMFNYVSPVAKRAEKPTLLKTSQDELPLWSKPPLYVQRTASMEALKLVANSLEDEIKELKLATFCSQAKEIYPSIKQKIEKNINLGRLINLERMTREHIDKKHKSALTLREVLVNSLSSDEMKRLELIKELKTKLKDEENIEKSTIAYMKNRSDSFVILRLCLWRLMSILENVDHRPISFRVKYPNSYLGLPLLKFEMLFMVAAPPHILEENLDKLMDNIKRKIAKLTKVFKPKMLDAIEESKEQFHLDFLEQTKLYDAVDHIHHDTKNIDYHLTDKATNVLNSKQIKVQSARIIENVKRETES